MINITPTLREKIDFKIPLEKSVFKAIEYAAT
jgi:hypothetical protein